MKLVKALAIDDNIASIMGYKYILENSVFEGHEVDIEMVTTYEEAKKRIEQSAKTERYDMLFLDVQLYPPNEDQPHTGEDLGILARTHVPETKIIFISSFSDNLRINSIIQTVDPEGYLVKSDISHENLGEVLSKVLYKPPYYSQLALEAIRRRMSSDIQLDQIDRQILYLLAKGTKNKDLEHFIGLSTSAIENRKRHLKVLFGTENENDLALIHAARRKGFI